MNNRKYRPIPLDSKPLEWRECEKQSTNKLAYKV